MQDFDSSNGGKYYFPLMYQLKKKILRKGRGNSPSQTSTAKQSFF